ncbi:FxLYD domain-containing protein [bacterium]|nr:FxLYD domain-containing protein [bacterium]
MTTTIGRSFRSTPLASWGLLACLLGALAGGCGTRAPRVTEDIANLRIDRYRYNLDEEHHLARVMAEIVNHGDRPVKEAMVIVTLRGPGGEERGINRVVVTDIKPGQPKVFTITVTGHGKERDVEFRIARPGAPEAQTSPDKDAAPDNSN